MRLNNKSSSGSMQAKEPRSNLLVERHTHMQLPRHKHKGALLVDSYLSAGHTMPQLDAVIIRNLTYELGSGRSKKAILNRINLTVPEGSM